MMTSADADVIGYDENLLAPSAMSEGQCSTVNGNDDVESVVTEALVDGDDIDSTDGGGALRIQLQNLPKFVTNREVRKLLTRVGLIKWARKIRVLKLHAFVSFTSQDAYDRALGGALSGQKMRGSLVVARKADEDSWRKTGDGTRPGHKRATEDGSELVEKRPRIDTAAVECTTSAEGLVDKVTPLWKMPYAEQLAQKQKDSVKLMVTLGKQFKDCRVDMKSFDVKTILKPIRASPVTGAYRNKCEFTVGKNQSSSVTVGFMAGKFGGSVESPSECHHLPAEMKVVCAAFEEFIRQSGLPYFDENAHKGFWRMLTVRSFTFDLMLIVTVNRRYFEEENTSEKTRETQLKQDLVTRFISKCCFAEDKFRVTSLYYSLADRASDSVTYELLGGAPFVYERILGKRFRVSPDAFFQTNTPAANVLYSVIAEVLNLDKETFLLDGCCGTGTIGICLADKCKAVLGIEMVSSSVEDARRNAAANQLASDSCRFACGRLEDIFGQLRYYLPPACAGTSIEDLKLTAVLDPPRVGLHPKLINPLRKLTRLRRFVFVSCDPHAAAARKNFADLCRPMSKSFLSEPFRLTSVTPVDMFPQTTHSEWVLLFER